MSHITLAASARAFELMFELVRDNLKPSKSDAVSFGPFTASYSVAVHLAGGAIQLNDDDTVEVTDMDVVWDTLDAKVCFDLPGFCVGGWCIVPDPFDGCWVSLPKVCIGGPICLDLDLGGLVSEVSDVKANLVPRYLVDPARPAGVSDLTAEFLGHPNKWQVFLNPVWVHVDPIDVPATIENVLENLFRKAIEDAFSWVPSWAWSLIWAVLGPLLDLLKTILGVVGELVEWVQNLLNGVFDLLGWLETAVADYLASRYPLFDFEDPYQVLEGDPSHDPIPVKIPLRNLATHVNSKEMVVTADIGA